MRFYNEDYRVTNSQINNELQRTQETFQALVDAIIPRTPRLAQEYGEIQYFGALDSYTDEYLGWVLNNYYIPLAQPLAEMLDIAATQLLIYEGKDRTSTFAALDPIDRFRAIIQLEQLKLYYPDIFIPFQNYPGLFDITSDLNRLTTLGYYSEWAGYGSTRLDTPTQRVLEYYPISWMQVGYPGPSLSYRAFVAEYYKLRKV